MPAVLLLLLTTCWTVSGSWPFESGYHRYASSLKLMQQLDATYQPLVRMYTIGKSANKLDMHVIELSSPATSHDLPKRSVRLIGGVFGDEPVGRELLLNFAHFLVTTFPKQPSPGRSPHLLDLLRVHILPTMNPDGSEVSREGACEHGIGRNNMIGVSLDKNFEVINATSKDHVNSWPVQSETMAVLNWMKKVPAVMSLTFRGGAFVVGYPYETRATPTVRTANVAPDEDVLRHLAHSYADRHPHISTKTVCFNRNSIAGVMNGATWRNGKGGLQDYSYTKTGSMHLNIGVTCCKYPNSSVLPSLWNDNKAALLALLAEATAGVNGVVLDAVTRKPVSEAKLAIVGRSSVIFRTAHMLGTFSRILLPGSYQLEVSKKGYTTTVEQFQVSKELHLHVEAQNFTVQTVMLEVLLHPEPELNVTMMVAAKVARESPLTSSTTTEAPTTPSERDNPTSAFLANTRKPRLETTETSSGTQKRRPVIVIDILIIYIMIFHVG